MKSRTLPNGLSVRANRCLAKAGIPLERDVVVGLLQAGRMWPFLWPPGYGKILHEEVCCWVDVNPEGFAPALRNGPTCPYPDIGLSYRAWNCLVRAGIATTKEAVLRALESGELCPGKCPGSYGKVTHAEVCRWVGTHKDDR